MRLVNRHNFILYNKSYRRTVKYLLVFAKYNNKNHYHEIAEFDIQSKIKISQVIFVINLRKHVLLVATVALSVIIT